MQAARAALSEQATQLAALQHQAAQAQQLAAAATCKQAAAASEQAAAAAAALEGAKAAAARLAAEIGRLMDLGNQDRAALNAARRRLDAQSEVRIITCQ